MTIGIRNAAIETSSPVREWASQRLLSSLRHDHFGKSKYSRVHFLMNGQAKVTQLPIYCDIAAFAIFFAL